MFVCVYFLPSLFVVLYIDTVFDMIFTNCYTFVLRIFILCEISTLIFVADCTLQNIFKYKSEYPTLTRMSYCQCRLLLVFLSIFKEFNWSHVALIKDRSDLFSLTVGKYYLLNNYLSKF